MNKVLLVGATGQLGTAVFQKLAATGAYAIRIMVREDSAYEHLKSADPEIVIGDLKNIDEIYQAVEGCDFVITTANSAAPRKKEDTFQAVDIDGFRDLIDAAKHHRVKHFIYTSAYPAEERWVRWIPLVKSKLATETYLKTSGLPYTIFQPDTFMDIYFAFMGTTIPVKNEVAALVNRPFKFMQKFYRGIMDDVDEGRIGIIGKGDTTHNYIAIDNVADFITKSVNNPDLFNKSYPIGGPEALTAHEVKAVFEKVLDKQLKVKKTPRFMMKLLGNLFSLFNEGASNILKLNYMAATSSTDLDCQELVDKLGIKLISAEEYLRTKVAEPVADVG